MMQLKRIPTLRFAPFTDKWNEKKFKEVYSFRITNSFSRENLNYENGFVKNIHYGDIHTKFATFFEITKEKVPFINPEINIHKIVTENYLKEGDLIFADASEDLNDVGKHIEIIQLNNEQLLSGLHTILARPINTHLYIGFAASLFKSTPIRLQIQKEAQGTKVYSISANRLSNISICFPSLQEQQKIATFFITIDTRLTQLKKQLNLLKDYKKGIMQQLFSQALRFKQTDGSDFGDWEVKKLGNVCEIIGGGTPETNNAAYWNGNIQWFTPTEIKSNFVSKSNRTITELGLKKSAAKLLPQGAILLTTRATIGDVSIALEPCTTNQGFQSLVVKQKIYNIFIFNWIKQNKDELLKQATGSTFLEISKSKLEQLPILIPCFEEQTQIANFLSAIDAQLTAVSTQISKTTAWKKGLLQQMFV